MAKSSSLAVESTGSWIISVFQFLRRRNDRGFVPVRQFGRTATGRVGSFVGVPQGRHSWPGAPSVSRILRFADFREFAFIRRWNVKDLVPRRVFGRTTTELVRRRCPRSGHSWSALTGRPKYPL